ncbi:DUF982 domain-containing protein [Rhizobium leguminosarum bv. viciae]|jgi:hypothetical protein|uniref:DUF982 domain-containing protein n=1 Tax=Rhizobium leguminosarum bv. viciae TaxID=387 RepID=A0A8I2KIL6_RHILV|nr:DUF982 domain-containing protein [Rhizobium leguminosarum]ASR07506.1 DUF982 domain-containing protein [Rhizobium leguminosarum bv. viciae]MBY5748661.1 DUF982 domain-containing protein [Rhizobium leguminosarum]MBY5795077.1 DUF982 domain-containing protein [Rhizobium leguminosarum]MBY5827017.1 DUF982 domain-containing protein [Rhizobium leguminosarum]NKM49708.1 DUF982 domain-containing protein [Rhizobium leguminosarum bv. viciae]
MALDTFEHPIYAQRKYFVQEIAGLDDVFDFLDEWPQEKRDITYEVMLDACRKAANRQLPASVVAANFSRFLKKHGKLADVEDVPLHLRRVSDRNVSGI